MALRPEALEKLLTALRTLPSVGPKMSERLAYHILKSSEEEVRALTQSVLEAYEKVRPCSDCGNWDESNPCRVCSDPERDPELLCVVENPQDLASMIRVRGFKGMFHVLGGALSPLDGVGPQDLRIDPLIKRLEQGTIREVVIALNPDMEGESTAQFLARQIQALETANGPIKVTRLAQGMPAGGELEYMDEVTLLRAFEGRRNLV